MIPQNFIDDFYRNKNDTPQRGNPATCPLCGYEVSYIGFNFIDCTNPDCKNYKQPEHSFEIKNDDWDPDDDTKELGDTIDPDSYL